MIRSKKNSVLPKITEAKIPIATAQVKP